MSRKQMVLRKLGLPALGLATILVGSAWLSQPAVSEDAAEVRRFAELSPADFEAFLDGESNLMVEFRVDDRIAFETTAVGDFLISESGEPITLRVASTFFLKLEGEELLMSDDGIAFKPLRDSVRGHLRATGVAGDDGRVDRIHLELNARRP